MPKISIRAFIRPKPKTVVYQQEVAYTDLSPEDQRRFDEYLHTPDPYAVLRAKSMHLADLLGCTEGQAEAIILDRVGSPDSGFTPL